jgi:hypothetical protein
MALCSARILPVAAAAELPAGTRTGLERRIAHPLLTHAPRLPSLTTTLVREPVRAHGFKG